MPLVIHHDKGHDSDYDNIAAEEATFTTPTSTNKQST